MRSLPAAKKSAAKVSFSRQLKDEQRPLYKAIRKCAEIEGSKWRVVKWKYGGGGQTDLKAETVPEVQNWIRERHSITNRRGPLIWDNAGLQIL